MKVQTVKKVLKAGYKSPKQNIDGYQRNNKLSGKRTQVYYDPITKKAIINHRGTNSLSDWMTDAAMAVGYEKGKRFQHSKKIQKETEKLYGRENVTTLGHSLGGRLAEKFGKKSSKVITYNKAATPKSILEKTPKSQFDIRAKGDYVSLLSKVQRKTNPTLTTKGSFDPIKSHGMSKLKYIKDKNI
jgi:hypothetical protein